MTWYLVKHGDKFNFFAFTFDYLMIMCFMSCTYERDWFFLIPNSRTSRISAVAESVPRTSRLCLSFTHGAVEMAPPAVGSTAHGIVNYI
jgi:hypothetical protein